MTVEVRLAEPADAEAICAVLRASITELLAHEHRNDPATLGPWLENKTVENALRWISADQEYGPEEAGPDGCEFLLVSYGPMDVQWEGGDR